MGSVVMRVKDDVMRMWLLELEVIEIEGGPFAERYEKILAFSRKMKGKSGYDPVSVEFFACLRRLHELSSKMVGNASRGEVSLEQEFALMECANELNRIVMYVRRLRT